MVPTSTAVSALLRGDGDAVEVIGPDRFRTVPAPSYPEIGLAASAAGAAEMEARAADPRSRRPRPHQTP